MSFQLREFASKSELIEIQQLESILFDNILHQLYLLNIGELFTYETPIGLCFQFKKAIVNTIHSPPQFFFTVIELEPIIKTRPIIRFV